MWRFISKVLFTSMLSFLAINAFSAETTTIVERKVITTPAPTASCKTVDAHWEGNEWVSQQTICTYSDRAEGSTWVESYWACTAYTADGTCTTWTLKPGHWVKTTTTVTP